MRTLQRLIALAVFPLLASCSDQTGPRVDDTATFAKGGRWVTLDGPEVNDGLPDVGTALPDISTTTCASDASQTDLRQCMLRHLPDAPPLMAYDTSFTVVQGERAEFVLHYVDPDVGDTGDEWGLLGTWFMRLSVPRDAQMLDSGGRLLAAGDTVEVTVTVDPELFNVEFTPHGSIFAGKKPALLEFSLEFAEVADLDPSVLDVWYRTDATDKWNALGTQFDKRGMKLQAPLYHFSGYAVAW
jgi:hypothetical protein